MCANSAARGDGGGGDVLDGEAVLAAKGRGAAAQREERKQGERDGERGALGGGRHEGAAVVRLRLGAARDVVDRDTDEPRRAPIGGGFRIAGRRAHTFEAG